MWKRYLLRGPKIFFLLGQLELRVRRSPVSAALQAPKTSAVIAPHPGEAI
jgi:hypothetical protein